MSSAIDYHQLIDSLKKDLALRQEALGKCMAQQEQLEREVAAIRSSITNFARMLDMEYVEEDDIGLTEAVRQVFKSAVGQSFIPTEIRDKLKGMGYDINKHGNVLASIHSVINRLQQRAEIAVVGQRNDGKTCYRWANK